MTTPAPARSALVTGASRGIGLGIAESLARQGFALTVTARDAARLEEVATQLRAAGAPTVAVHAADLSDVDAAPALVDAHAAAHGGLDVLVLNAGMGSLGDVAEVPMRRVRKLLDVNLLAPLALVQAALPLLRDAAAVQPVHGARIVALSSITGVYTEEQHGAYAATKAALLSLVDTINLEENQHGVTAAAVSPGYVATDMTSWMGDDLPPDRMIPVSDVVAVVDLLVGLSRRTQVGQVLMARAGTDGRRA